MSEQTKGYKINFENLDKSFGDLEILKNINLSIAPGEFVAIVGHSGCGKSTLLRMIEGLDAPSAGSIVINGKKVDGVDSNIRFIFQDARLLPWKNVLNNVRIGAKNKDEEKAKAALEHVGLLDRKTVWPAVLSGGQKQRVSLARALSGEPSVLLLDEPLGALDALTRLEMQTLIERLWTEQGFTAILVTHDVSEAVKLADRVIVIDEHSVKLDLEISLPRPREKNNDSSYFEQKILNYLMRNKEEDVLLNKNSTDFAI